MGDDVAVPWLPPAGEVPPGIVTGWDRCGRPRVPRGVGLGHNPPAWGIPLRARPPYGRGVRQPGRAMLRPNLLLASLLVSACAPTRQVSGSAPTAVAVAPAAAGRLKVRPNEVSWTLGDPVQVEAHIAAEELGTFTSTGLVWARGGGPLPDFVELAATRRLADAGADGLLVTNWTNTAKTRAGATTHHVRVWGLLLELQDLGPMSEERADLRDTVRALEAAHLRLGRP